MPDKITIRACTALDIPLADYVLRHPEVYPYTMMDGKPKDPMRYTIADKIKAGPPTYVLMDNENSFVAILYPETNCVWSSHSNALPNIRGKRAIKICKMMCQWMFDNTPCDRIIGFTPDNNKAALMFNRLCGFKKITEIPNAYLLEGQYHSVHLVSKEKSNG